MASQCLAQLLLYRIVVYHDTKDNIALCVQCNKQSTLFSFGFIKGTKWLLIWLYCGTFAWLSCDVIFLLEQLESLVADVAKLQNNCSKTVL